MKDKGEALARLAHEINRAYCQSIGDMSHAPWEHTPEEIQDSARVGVLRLLENYALTPSELHEHWRNYKTAHGWTYGPIKDLEKKTHPCLVPYNDLPIEQQIKDALFRATVLEGLKLIE